MPKRKTASRKRPTRYVGPRPPHLAGRTLGGYKVGERIWPQRDGRARYHVTCVRCRKQRTELGSELTLRQREKRRMCPDCRAKVQLRANKKVVVKRLLSSRPRLPVLEIAKRSGVSDAYVYLIRDGKR